MDHRESARLKTPALGKKSVEGKDAWQIVSQGKIKGHLNDSSAHGFRFCFRFRLLSEMDSSLVNTQGQRQAEGGSHRTDQKTDGPPAMTSEVGRFALRFGILVQRNDAGHPAAVFRHIGMVPEQNGPAIGPDGFVLCQNEGGPAADERIQVPRARVKEVTKCVIGGCTEPPESTKGGNAANFICPEKTEDNDSEDQPGAVS
jgi:hypothetical protein